MSADHMIMLYDIEKSSREWMKGLRAAQIESGQIPVIVPTSGWGYDWGTGPAWDSVLFNLPYLLYKIRGCTDIVNENSHAMVRYLDYILTKRNENGTLSYGLGDWCPVGKAEHQYNVPLEISNVASCNDRYCAAYGREFSIEEMFDRVKSIPVITAVDIVLTQDFKKNLDTVRACIKKNRSKNCIGCS